MRQSECKGKRGVRRKGGIFGGMDVLGESMSTLDGLSDMIEIEGILTGRTSVDLQRM